MQNSSWIIFLLMLFVFPNAIAQKSITDFKLEEMKSELNRNTSLSSNPSHKKPVKKKGVGNFLLNIYQKHISVQISADCLYSLSCSRYSREVVNSKGLFLGVLLSADRLTRCSGFCAKDIPYQKYNDEGLVEDNP